MKTKFIGLVRALGSIESIEKNTQFWISLVGQALTGMGNPMAVSVPTKVSQHWFVYMFFQMFVYIGTLSICLFCLFTFLGLVKDNVLLLQLS